METDADNNDRCPLVACYKKWRPAARRCRMLSACDRVLDKQSQTIFFLCRWSALVKPPLGGETRPPMLVCHQSGHNRLTTGNIVLEQLLG